MRKDTTVLIPEFDKETKETLESLINYNNTQKEISLIEEQKVRADKLLSGVTDEYEKILENCVKSNITVDDIEKKLTDDEIAKLFIREDGTEIPFNVPVDDKKRLISMKRDFVSMLLNNQQNIQNIDESLEELYKAQKEYDEEVKNVFSEFNGDITSYSRNKLKEQLLTLDPESDTAIGIKHVLNAMDDAVDLNSLYETFKNLDPRNTINDFLRNSENLATQFMKNAKRNGIAIDFSKYDYLEHLFLEEKYQTYRNLFIFLIVKKYAKKKEFSRTDAIFLTQLIVNIQILLYDHKRGSELSEEQLQKRNRLIAGIERVLDLFYTDAN